MCIKKNVLIIGSGGREHALAWKLLQSPHVGTLYVAPGNAGTLYCAHNTPIAATKVAALAQFAKRNRVHLTIVGPDEPLAEGIVDTFQDCGLRIFGPTRGAAQIEWSKSFAKDLMNSIGIPTADSQIFDVYDTAFDYTHTRGVPLVIKADGLARGKGVYPCNTEVEAEQALAELMLECKHGEAGTRVVIEDKLWGAEYSLHALCDGTTTAHAFPLARDYKLRSIDPRSPNTGGMGAYAPIPGIPSDDVEALYDITTGPILKALSAQRAPFRGLLYPGVIDTAEGVRVLEYNGRFGDPETQVYLRLLKSDLFELLWACTEDNLAAHSLEWHAGYAVCVVLASEGYPGPSKTGNPIYGIKEAESVPGIVVFHAGTAYDGTYTTAGGRVLNVTAVGDTLGLARTRAYEAVSCIRFTGMYYRDDIGV